MPIPTTAKTIYPTHSINRAELVHGSDWVDLDEVDPALFDYIEVFYNRVRLHSSLGHKSPLVYEQQAA